MFKTISKYLKIHYWVRFNECSVHRRFHESGTNDKKNGSFSPEFSSQILIIFVIEIKGDLVEMKLNIAEKKSWKRAPQGVNYV